MLDRLPFRHIVGFDAEFHFGGHATPAEAGRSGERPRPVCMVARELRSGRDLAAVLRRVRNTTAKTAVLRIDRR